MKRRGLLAGIFGGIAAAFARPAAAKPLEGADSRHTIEVLVEMWIRVGDPNNLPWDADGLYISVDDQGRKARWIRFLGDWYAQGTGKNLRAPDEFRWLPGARVY